MVKSPRRFIIVVVGLCVLAVYVVSHWDSYRLEQELEGIAARKAQEAETYLTETPGRVATSVVATRSAVVLGEARGKVSVYIERGELAQIEGYEYFFAREASGEWRQTESGRCSSEQCSIEGRKLMQALDQAQ